MKTQDPPLPAIPKTVAFIGTGNMGLPLIEKLAAAGYTLRLYDKFQTNKEKLSGPTISWWDTPREACIGVDTAITCLPLPHHVLENMSGPDGALASLGDRTTWIDTSTTDYHNTCRIARDAAKQGVLSLEAPVSNLSHMGVDFANVCFYVGGDASAYRVNRKLIDTMGRKSFYVGEIGMGQTVKLFTNLLFYTAMVGWGDVLVLARHHGIPLKWFWNRIRASHGNCFVTDQLTPFVFGGSYDRSCTLEITVKDTSLVVDLAEELGCPSPIGKVVRERYSETEAVFDSQDNHVLVIQLAERDANTRLQIERFTAPSPYGQNPRYVHSQTMINDEYGRTKPFIEQKYYDAPKVSEPRLQGVADALISFMALLNYRILQETRTLAHRKGLSHDLITEVVRWSCGPSWVGDNEANFVPDETVLNEIRALADGVTVSSIKKLCAVLGAPQQADVIPAQ